MTSLPSKQRAAVFKKVGEPITLEEDFPIPPFTDDDVLVRVHAAAVNPVDHKVMKINDQWPKLPLPAALGLDVSGVVVAVGKNVSRLKVNDEVFGVGALNRPGTFAQYTAVLADSLAIKPANCPHDQAGAIGVTYLSSWLGLALPDAAVKANDTVYIPGGAGGVAHLGIQIAKNFGARVITSASKPESIKYLKDVLKADVVVNYKEGDVAEAILKATNNEGVDFVWDVTQQASSHEIAVKILKKGGILSLLMPTVPAEGSEVIKQVKEKNITYVIRSLGDYAFAPNFEKNSRDILPGLEAAAKWFSEGKLVVNISETITLDETPAALNAGRNATVGKLGVKVV